MIRHELIEGQYSVHTAELGTGLCTIEKDFVYYSPDIEVDLDLFVGKNLRLNFGPSIIAMPIVQSLWCNGVVALFCDRSLVRFVDKKAKKARPKIKCLEVPYYCRSFFLRELNGVQEHPDALPTVDRDGWYRISDGHPIEWVEYQGKVYEPIGSLLEELERLTIAERPLRDCEFGLFRQLLKERPYGLSSPLKSELRKFIGWEALKRSTRRTRCATANVPDSEGTAIGHSGRTRPRR